MKHFRQKSVLLSLSFVLLVAAAADAVDRAQQTHNSIREAAREHASTSTDHLAGRVEVTVGSLDSRLRLAACDLPLTTYDSPNGLNAGRGVVGVRCEGSKPWKLYVPVRIATFGNVVVTSRPIVRGQSVRAGDVTLKEVDISGLRKAFFSRVEDVVGLRAKRSVAGSKILHAGLLRHEQLIKRGARVQIIANTGGLHVTMRGKALADGRRGDRIRVKNLNSGRVVSGTVSGRGVISVTD